MKALLKDKNGEVNYIKLVNWFWNTVPYSNNYKNAYGILFLAIVDSINRNKWRKTLIERDVILNKCPLGNKMYLEARKWLMDNGLLQVEIGKNSYQMASFQIGIEVLNDTATDTSTDTSTASLPTSIYKINNKPLNNKPINIPFDVFWNLYDKKKGSKEKSEKLWEKLTDEERQKTMDHITIYKKENPDEQYRKHPEGYLSNKLFNNETADKTNETGSLNYSYAKADEIDKKYD